MLGKYTRTPAQIMRRMTRPANESPTMQDTPHNDPLVEGLAKLLAPSWFHDEWMESGAYPLDNYPDQHIKFRERARERAVKIIELIKEAVNHSKC